MSTIHVEKVFIPELFLKSGVKKEKIARKAVQIKNGHDLKVTLNSNNVIIDGYATYLAYRNLGYKQIPCTYSNKFNGHVEAHKPRHALCDRVSNRELIIARADSKCYICGRKLKRNEITIDHMIPKSIGGSNDASNLSCCCKLCNTLKGQLSYSKELRGIIRKELTMRGIQVY